MTWQFDPYRHTQVRKIANNIEEVVGRLTSPSDAILSSLPALMPLVDLFCISGAKDWEYAPDCLRLRASKVQRIEPGVINWAVQEGIIVAIERRGAPIAYRISEAWQSWLLDRVITKEKGRQVEWTKLDSVYERYGCLGLRIASQIAYGNSHRLDGLDIPPEYHEKVWAHTDPIVKGANVLRIGGRISVKTRTATYMDTWDVPGHYLWPWDIDTIKPNGLIVSNRILLVENVYAYWHLLGKFRERDCTLICLHGETRQPGFLGEDATLFKMLQRIISLNYATPIGIWCDPDPGGLVMASNARAIIQSLGGQAYFCMMQSDVLTRIDELVLAENKMLPLDAQDLTSINSGLIHEDLSELLHAIRTMNTKGEQECLALLFDESLLTGDSNGIVACR